MVKQQGGSTGGQWAQQQKDGLKRQDEAEKNNQQHGQNRPAGQSGDDRTPDEPIGEVAYAERDPAKKKTGEF